LKPGWGASVSLSTAFGQCVECEDAKYLHPVFENSVENLIWITNKWDDAYSWPVSNRRRGFGMLGYIYTGCSNSQFDGKGHLIAKCAAIRSYFAKIG
jgi:hypothetical protein